ncbi:unnamed protein product [Pedinophyceae sp. YPF-701]|nr:unnamed protein product [Pedinophyceae sp. YPF-701]
MMRGRHKWTKKGPLELRHHARALLGSEKEILIFCFSGALKEQWFHALAEAVNPSVAQPSSGAAGGASTLVQSWYRAYMETARAANPHAFPTDDTAGATPAASVRALAAAGDASARVANAPRASSGHAASASTTSWLAAASQPSGAGTPAPVSRKQSKALAGKSERPPPAPGTAVQAAPSPARVGVGALLGGAVGRLGGAAGAALWRFRPAQGRRLQMGARDAGQRMTQRPSAANVALQALLETPEGAPGARGGVSRRPSFVPGELAAAAAAGMAPAQLRSDAGQVAAEVAPAEARAEGSGVWEVASVGAGHARRASSVAGGAGDQVLAGRVTHDDNADALPNQAASALDAGSPKRLTVADARMQRHASISEGLYNAAAEAGGQSGAAKSLLVDDESAKSGAGPAATVPALETASAPPGEFQGPAAAPAQADILSQLEGGWFGSPEGRERARALNAALRAQRKAQKAAAAAAAASQSVPHSPRGTSTPHKDGAGGALAPEQLAAQLAQALVASEGDAARDARAGLAGTAILNTMLSRVWFDLMRNPTVEAGLLDRIQTRLERVPLPPYMGPLKLVALKLGARAPVVRGAQWAGGVAVPKERRGSGAGAAAVGLYPAVDAEVFYEGEFELTIETSFDLAETSAWGQLEKVLEALEGQGGGKRGGSQKVEVKVEPEGTATGEVEAEAAAIEAEMEAEARAEGRAETLPPGSAPVRGALLALLPKPLRQVAVKGVRRVTGAISSHVGKLALQLHVRLLSLEGRVRIWLPPPPSDRIWYGFHAAPRLRLEARPRINSQPVRQRMLASRIGGVFERRLAQIINNALVLPNCEGITIVGLLGLSEECVIAPGSPPFPPEDDVPATEPARAASSSQPGTPPLSGQVGLGLPGADGAFDDDDDDDDEIDDDDDNDDVDDDDIGTPTGNGLDFRGASLHEGGEGTPAAERASNDAGPADATARAAASLAASTPNLKAGEPVDGTVLRTPLRASYLTDKRRR